MNECRPIDGFDPGSVTQPVNRWIITELMDREKDISGTIEAYRFNETANALYHFTWGSFCDWYLELIKPVLIGDDEAAKAETRATCAWVLDQILKMLHPVMPPPITTTRAVVFIVCSLR